MPHGLKQPSSKDLNGQSEYDRPMRRYRVHEARSIFLRGVLAHLERDVLVPDLERHQFATVASSTILLELPSRHPLLVSDYRGGVVS